MKNHAREPLIPPLDTLKTSLEHEATERFSQFLTGIHRYRTYPRQPVPKRPPPFWKQGTTEVHKHGLSGPPILIIPSLINRGDIFDLCPTHSFVRTLARDGFQVFWVDWGTPRHDEFTFGLSDYVLKRLSPAVEHIRNTTGYAPVVIGYCMGGLLALALVAHRPDICRAYGALATPWDFHVPGTLKNAADHFGSLCISLAEQIGFLPEDILHAFFSSLTPGLVAQKFRRFADLPYHSPQADMFVAVEDWLSDGVPVTTTVIRECLELWYRDNATARLQWSVADTRVSPDQITVPSFVVLSTCDRLVPLDSSRALAQALPHAHTITVDLGHIGMMTGCRAYAKVHVPLKQWIAAVTKN